MKLSKVNNNGCLAIILPKALTEELNWEKGLDVDVTAITDNSILISKQDKKSIVDLDIFLEEIKTIPQTIESLSKIHQQFDKQLLKKLLKNYLLSYVEKL